METTTIEAIKSTDSVKLDPNENFSRQYLSSKTESTTGSTQKLGEIQSSAEGENEEEVDVDLSQLQISLPNVKFDCSGHQEGYYGDPDYRCEVFHYCNSEGKRDTFLCPSNSKFNQKDMTCDTDSTEDLCKSEPVWGHNHLYPTSLQSSSSVSTVKEKNQFEVTAPKYETKENGFREPVYEMNSYDIKSNTNAKNDEKDNKNVNSNSNEDNTSTGNSKSNKDNERKEIKLSYFGGNFGERQRNTNTNINNNDRKISNYNNDNNGKNQYYKDFGTTSDANKKQSNDQKENNKNNPVMIHGNGYNHKKQSFTPTNYQSSGFNRFENKPLDMNPIHNKNYDISQAEHHSPSSPPEKAFLSPPVQTEKPSSLPPNRAVSHYEKHKNSDHSVRQSKPTVESRPHIKWPNRKHTDVDSYYTNSDNPTQPPSQIQTPPPEHVQVHVPRHVAKPQQQPQPYTPAYNPVVEYKPIQPQNIVKELTKVFEIPLDLWPQTGDKESVQPNVVHESQSQQNQQSIDSNKYKNTQNDNKELENNWSPIDHHIKELISHSPKHLKHAPSFTSYNSLEKYQHNSQKDDSDVTKHREPVYQNQNQNKNQNQNQNQNHNQNHNQNQNQNQNNRQSNKNSGNSDNKQEYNEQNREMPQNYKLPIPPPKPQWAQELYELSELQNNQQISQSSQPQKYSKEIPVKIKSETNHYFYNNNQNSNKKDKNINKNSNRGPEKQVWAQQTNGNRFEYNNDNRDTAPISPVTNYFYEQFRPYKSSENNPIGFSEKKPLDEKQVKHFYVENIGNEKISDNRYQSELSIKSAIGGLKNINKPFKHLNQKKLTGYVPERLPVGELFGNSDIDLVTKIPKHFEINPKKTNRKAYKPIKNNFKPQNIVEELLSADNGWALKNFDTTGIETAFSHNFPIMPMNSRPKSPKRPFGRPIVTHFHSNPSAIGFPFQPQPQPSMIIPQQMPLHQPLRAQHSFPMHYYLPIYPMSQQRHKSINQLRVRPFANTRIWK